MAIRKATGIGSVNFDYSMIVEEELVPSNLDSEVHTSESGIHLVWTRELKTPYITLVSGEHGWIKKADVESIRSMYSVLGGVYTLMYDNGDTQTVRFAHEKGIEFTPLWEGSEYFVATINLAKIIV